MGIDWLEIGVKMRKGMIFTIRGCFRSVCNHPFLVGLLCFLIFMYRSFPSIFSLLVSSSPILVCTAVLLGVLLSYGQPNIPEIEIEEKTTFEAVSIKTGVLGDGAVIEKNESYYVERFSEKRRDEEQQSTDQLGEVCREECPDYTAPLIEERSREVGLNGAEIWEANRELGGLRYEQKTEWIEERLGDGEVEENKYASEGKGSGELLESDDEKSEADSFDSETVNVDSLDSPLRSPWKRVEEREDEEEDDEEDDDSDLGSGRAESSSPDASMADIMPMLDELHPLLEEDVPQPVHMSHGDSDVASDKSLKSSTSSHESDEEAENHEDLEVADDENEDAQGDKEEQKKSAITWTEEDQKNLMDLGSSEIERNQRLENLILRRRARKNMSMLAERNLIDFESSDLPFNIAPISTRRQNPFDLPLDSHDDLGLPPIPGSAPSILQPRRNPFDIPYDSSEEKPNLMSDGFHEEFISQSRESFFRRHESFNLRPSIFAPSRQNVKMRPYFVTEAVSEESSFSPFQRQSSELSESKVSSVPETESIGSVTDLEDRKHAEEDAWTKEVTEGPLVDPELILQQEEVAEEDIHRKPERISKIECVSEHVGHGSQSSEEEDSLELGQGEKSDVEGDELEFQMHVADHSHQGSIIRPFEVPSTEYASNYETVEHRYSRDSSSSSLSEVSERVFVETGGEGLSVFEERGDDVAEERSILTQTSVENTDFGITNTMVHDIPHREPVYDTSPRGLRENVSSSSISSDVNPESDPSFPTVLIKRTLSFTVRESEGTLLESSISYPADDSRPIDVVNISEHDNVNTDFSGVDQRSERDDSSASPGIITHVAVEASLEENIMEQHGWVEVPDSSADTNINTSFKFSEDQNLDKLQEEYLLTERGSLTEVIEPLVEDQPRAEHIIGMEETVQLPNIDAGVCHEADAKLISTPAAEEDASPFYDKPIHEPIVDHLNEVKASSTSSVESSEDVLRSPELKMAEIQDLENAISSNVDAPLSDEFISILTSATETNNSHVDVQTIIEDEVEIKEIDGLLSELDNVGDFSIKQWESGSSEFGKHTDSVEESWFSVHNVETSTTRVVEVDSVEENKIEDALHSEKARENIVTYEEDLEHISEPQISETTIAGHIDVSKMEFNERDGQDSPDEEISEDKTLSKENEVHSATLVNHDYEENISEIPELEVQSAEVDFVSKKSELTSVETEFVGGVEISYRGQVVTDTTSRMTELEASTIEDIDLVFKQISDKDTEKTVLLEPSLAELEVQETIVEHSEDLALHRNSSVLDSTHEMSDLEVKPTECATLDYKQLNDSSTGSPRLPDSVDRTLHVVESGETQETSSEMHVAELILKQMLDSEALDHLKLNTDDGLVETKADEVASSVESPSIKQSGAIAAEKPDHEIKAPKDLHPAASVKGKGKISKSSSSSSSSSSESSSSDSDRE